MRHTKAFLTFVLGILVLHGVTMSQIQVKPLPHAGDTKVNARLSDSHTILNLPFWDDFSRSNQLVDTMWQNLNGVTISNYIGIDAPSINVATFNGVDATGRPYASSPTFGKTDSLQSMPINLGSLTNEQKESLFLSFFWQPKGFGDKPNPSDSIRLLFKSNKGNWHKQWTALNVDPQKENRFNQTILKVTGNGLPADETFFHEDFQFRFQAYGNQGGDYDNWHIDYVYLNHSRNSVDTLYQDEALTTPPSSLFQPYYAIPYKVILQHAADYMAKPFVQYKNLTAIRPTPKLHAAVSVLQDGNMVLLDSTLGAWTFAPFPFPGESRWIRDRIDALKVEKLTGYPDSTTLTLESKVFITSNDPVYPRMNHRWNDTVRAITYLKDYYAYDDGTAEASIGIDRQGGRIAYMFAIAGQDTITDVDIYFPNFSSSGGSSTIKLQIWRRLADANPVYQESYPVQYSSTINELKRYKLARPVIVTDTFFVGYEQNINKFLSIGYDRNNDSSDKLYYYVDLNQGWLLYHDKENPSAGVIPGSLMIRPVFGEIKITGIGKEWTSNINIYPNPTRGNIQVQGDFQQADIFILDAYGRSIKRTNLFQIDLHGLPSGVYFLRIVTNQGAFTRKVILQ